MVSTQEIRVVAELLQISPEGLQKAVTYKVTVSIKPCPVCMCTDVLSFVRSVLENNKHSTAVCDIPEPGGDFSTLSTGR